MGRPPCWCPAGLSVLAAAIPVPQTIGAPSTKPSGAGVAAGVCLFGGTPSGFLEESGFRTIWRWACCGEALLCLAGTSLSRVLRCITLGQANSRWIGTGMYGGSLRQGGKKSVVSPPACYGVVPGRQGDRSSGDAHPREEPCGIAGPRLPAKACV